MLGMTNETMQEFKDRINACRLEIIQSDPIQYSNKFQDFLQWSNKIREDREHGGDLSILWTSVHAEGDVSEKSIERAFKRLLKVEDTDSKPVGSESTVRIHITVYTRNWCDSCETNHYVENELMSCIVRGNQIGFELGAELNMIING